MSQENLDVMRRWAETWNRIDLEGFAAMFDENAELITDPSWMEAGPFRGRAAIRAWFEGLKESWDGHDTVEVIELFEVGENVIARIDWQVRGRASGIATALNATSINLIEGSRIVRQQWFLDHDKALEAVGLLE